MNKIIKKVKCHRLPLLLMLLVFTAVLAGCGDTKEEEARTEAKAAEEPQETEKAVESTPEPEDSPKPVVSESPVVSPVVTEPGQSPAPTPEPTLEPTPEPTPGPMKKIACLGDSITEWGPSWVENVRTSLGLEEAYNLGIAQSTIAASDQNPYYARYQEIPADSDIIFVFGGTNDYYQGIGIGSVDSEEPAEFSGALNVLCRGLKQSYPNAVIVFATPIQRTSSYGLGPNTSGLMLSDYCDAIQGVCGKYGIPVIDLFHGSGITVDNADAYLEDGLHPNAEGYRLLGDAIAGKLKKIID